MNINKSATGNNIQLTKQEWLDIGNKAGWTKTAQNVPAQNQQVYQQNVQNAANISQHLYQASSLIRKLQTGQNYLQLINALDQWVATFKQMSVTPNQAPNNTLPQGQNQPVAPAANPATNQGPVAI